jgi:hypothetical protein
LSLGPYRLVGITLTYWRAVLAVVAFAELDAGDLGDGVGFVGGLERAGEEVVFLDRLGAVARVDAARAQEAQALHAGLEGAVDQVGFWTVRFW